MLMKLALTLAVIPSGIAPILFVVKTVPVRRERLCVSLSFLWALTFYVSRNFIFGDTNPVLGSLGVAGLLVITLLFTAPGHRAWALVSALVYYGSTFIPLLAVTLLASLLAEPLGYSMDYLMRDGWGPVVMALITFAAIVPVLFLCRRLLRRLMAARISLAMAGLFALVAASQLIMLVMLIEITNGHNPAATLPYVVPLALVICLGADLALYFAMGHIRREQALKSLVPRRSRT